MKQTSLQMAVRPAEQCLQFLRKIPPVSKRSSGSLLPPHPYLTLPSFTSNFGSLPPPFPAEHGRLSFWPLLLPPCRLLITFFIVMHAAAASIIISDKRVRERRGRSVPHSRLRSSNFYRISTTICVVERADHEAGIVSNCIRPDRSVHQGRGVMDIEATRAFRILSPSLWPRAAARPFLPHFRGGRPRLPPCKMFKRPFWEDRRPGMWLGFERRVVLSLV